MHSYIREHSLSKPLCIAYTLACHPHSLAMYHKFNVAVLVTTYRIKYFQRHHYQLDPKMYIDALYLASFAC